MIESESVTNLEATLYLQFRTKWQKNDRIVTPTINPTQDCQIEETINTHTHTPSCARPPTPSPIAKLRFIMDMAAVSGCFCALSCVIEQARVRSTFLLCAEDQEIELEG
jgi:hypothetical protein